MKLTIVLPCSGRRPGGGHRIVYEHANRLVPKGHDVHLVHLSYGDVEPELSRYPREMLRFARDRLTGGYLPKEWFTLDPRVETSLRFRQSATGFPEADAVMATAWETAPLVNSLPISCGRKFYFVQCYEIWSGPEELVRATWKLPLHKLVVSHWLGNIAEEMNEAYDLVANGIDLNFFSMKQTPRDRPHTSVLFSSMSRERKGSADIVQALNALWEKGTRIKILAFGNTDPAHFGLRAPYTFFANPSQSVLADLYNRTAIFVSASHLEGWGLTICEAASCGAALVASDIGGHAELAADGRNALLFKPRDSSGLARQIERLVSDPELRIKLAEQGHSDVHRFDWATASAAMEQALLRAPNKAAEGRKSTRKANPYAPAPR